MILGIGSDLVDIRRIDAALARFGDRFTHRCFTPVERAKADRRADRAGTYAKRFAAKEACAKALGTGLRGIRWQEMEVVNLLSGQPTLHLSGAARKRLDALTPPRHHVHLHVSLTDDHPIAQAFVIIEARRIES